jgi:LysM repeat protein
LSPIATTAPSGPAPAPAVTEPTAAPPAQTETGSADFVWYTVQSGDTLNSIAQRYGTTSAAITSANDLTNPSQIYAGQKLKIPTSAGSPAVTTSGCRYKHKVKSGEWVWQIARQYGVSPYDILSANNLTIDTARTVYPGTVLCIP